MMLNFSQGHKLSRTVINDETRNFFSIQYSCVRVSSIRIFLNVCVEYIASAFAKSDSAIAESDAIKIYRNLLKY